MKNKTRRLAAAGLALGAVGLIGAAGAASEKTWDVATPVDTESSIAIHNAEMVEWVQSMSACFDNECIPQAEHDHARVAWDVTLYEAIAPVIENRADWLKPSEEPEKPEKPAPTMKDIVEQSRPALGVFGAMQEDPGRVDTSRAARADLLDPSKWTEHRLALAREAADLRGDGIDHGTFCSSPWFIDIDTPEVERRSLEDWVAWNDAPEGSWTRAAGEAAWMDGKFGGGLERPVPVSSRRAPMIVPLWLGSMGLGALAAAVALESTRDKKGAAK